RYWTVYGEASSAGTGRKSGGIQCRAVGGSPIHSAPAGHKRRGLRMPPTQIVFYESIAWKQQLKVRNFEGLAKEFDGSKPVIAGVGQQHVSSFSKLLAEAGEGA